MPAKRLPVSVKRSCYRCCHRCNSRTSVCSTCLALHHRNCLRRPQEPRSPADVPEHPPPPQRPPQGQPEAQEGAQRGAMRRRIVALLQDHPEGLTPAEIRTLLGVDKPLGDTCLGMRRDGWLRRVEPGRYVVA